jgi:hypothetical protein
MSDVNRAEELLAALDALVENVRQDADSDEGIDQSTLDALSAIPGEAIPVLRRVIRELEAELAAAVARANNVPGLSAALDEARFIAVVLSRGGKLDALNRGYVEEWSTVFPNVGARKGQY